ncbi:TPA: hypothetical protein WN018_001300, partial [Neisseria gonorrhoeae]
HLPPKLPLLKLLPPKLLLPKHLLPKLQNKHFPLAKKQDTFSILLF